MTVTLFGYLILISIDLNDVIKRINQTLKTVFDHIYKHLKVHQK